jgi:hypothetical protein
LLFEMSRNNRMVVIIQYGLPIRLSY